MISTVRGLVIACAIAVVLAALAIFTGGRAAGPVDRALVPGFAADAVTALAWTREGAPPIRIARDRASPTGWSWAEPRGAADARAVEDALAALRGGRWHRRGPVTAAGKIEATLEVTGAAPLAVGVGAPLAGTEQRWLAIGGRAYLVDTWVARALAPEPLALRVRRPLARIASAARIEVSPGGTLGRVTLAGTPRRVAAPFTLLLDPIVAAAIEQPLAELEVVELPRGPVAPHGEGIVADGVVVRDAGACPGSPGRWAIDGTAGPGCVGEGAWENAKRAIWTLTQLPAQLAERRPAPVEPAKITLADGVVLDLAGQARIGDRDVDPAAAIELLAALGAPAEPVAVPQPPGKPLGTISITDRGGAVLALDLYAPNLAVRRGEPVALRVGEGAFRVLVRPSTALRDPTPWREEPSTVAALELDGTTYTRGVVLGEWTRAGPGRDDPAAVEKLVAALAAPQVRARAGAVAPRHTITLHVRPPAGAPVKRTLRVGDPAAAAGCLALSGDEAISLAPEVCALVRALAL